MNTSMNHQQLISWMINDPAHKMTRDTNAQFEYLNFGYCLLGRVIEKVTGQGYEQYVKQNVLAPPASPRWRSGPTVRPRTSRVR